ncbi:MAG: thioredoxin family protein [Segetibacter sp.]
MAAAKVLNKPVMLDFTGHSCANCRKMEAEVWDDPEVMKRIKEDFVLISLVCR